MSKIPEKEIQSPLQHSGNLDFNVTDFSRIALMIKKVDNSKYYHLYQF